MVVMVISMNDMSRPAKKTRNSLDMTGAGCLLPVMTVFILLNSFLMKPGLWVVSQKP